MDRGEQRNLHHDYFRLQWFRQRHGRLFRRANTGSTSRNGTMTIAGQTFTVTQAGTGGGGTNSREPRI